MKNAILPKLLITPQKHKYMEMHTNINKYT